MGTGVSIHTRITEACLDLQRLLQRLEDEVPHKKRSGFTAGGSPGKGGSRPLASWNTPAAMLVMTIHQGLRELEKEMQVLTSGTARPRGGADGVTAVIIARLPSLAAGADEHAAFRVARAVESWCWQSRIVLGEAEPWQHIPRRPGQPPAQCPWCGFRTLRYKPFAGIVRCVNPGCTDNNGNRPVGRVEVGDLSQEPLLAWADGSTGIGTGT